MFTGNSGGGGNDQFIGGPGTDHFFGGKGNDTYQFEFTGGGNDQINESILGGKGSDIIQITTPVGASYADLNFQRVDADSVGSIDDLLITYNGQSITVINQFSGEKDANVGIENMSFNGGNYAGYSLGTGPYNILSTSGGDDIVAGTSSNDILNGGSGGNDLIFAGASNDTVDGGSGNDLLVGGTGNDTLTGGGGDDRFAFAETGAANVDTITDYSVRDVIDLSPLLDSQFGPTDNPADFTRLVQNGSDVVVQADLDGAANGGNFVDVTVLSGYGTAAPDLVHVHFGNTTHDLLV
jgi:Ca2+-binding RTX toxin-like protein